MAAKQYIDLADLALYKELYDDQMATAIATAEARSLHTVAISGTTLNFYREEEPVGSATPAYSISLPQQDLSNYLQKIASVTAAGDIVTVNADGTISDGGIALSAVALSADLAAVATSGDADDVAYDNTESGLTSTDVQAALDELAGQSAGGVASKTVYITETAGGSGAAYSKRYGIYQGSEGSAADPVVGEKLADIDIPKDMVVEAGEVVDVVYDNGHLYEGSTSGTDVTEEIKGAGGTATAADAGKYIKLTIANSSGDHLWIAAADLVDTYTAASGATQVQLAISSSNEISATLVDGGVSTAKIADDAVTAAKISVAEHSEHNVASPDASDPVKVVVTTEDGQVSGVAVEVASGVFEPAGTAELLIESLDADLDASGTAQYGGTFVVSGVTEVDGVLTAVDSVEVEAAGAAAEVLGGSGDTYADHTVYGAFAYADKVAGDATESVPEADIRALFNSPSV